MIDSTTDERITISTEGTGGPYIIVPPDQLETVRRMLRRNHIPHTADKNSGAGLDVVNLGSADVAEVQRILDGLKGKYESIDTICSVVRKCFPPQREIILDEGEVGRNSVAHDVFVVARVKGDRLGAYDQKHLLEAIGGELVEADDKKALIKGTLGGDRYELRLLCE